MNSHNVKTVENVKRVGVIANGVNLLVRKKTMVNEYLLREKIEGRFLVVINDEIIPRSAYSQTELSAGDKIDIVSPISGG